jgi:hypothetical protein
MEILELIFGAIELLGGFGELIVGLIDLLALFKSKENRHQRRQAKYIHADLPSRNLWSWLLLILTPLLLFMTGVLIWKHFLRS